LFQLLQPIWLFALAGLSVPVIIHLWNQRPGKTLRVGSIAMVTDNAVSHKKNIRLTEILLLLLRCLLLSCVVVALAGPFWKYARTNDSKGWVLMSRQQLAATYQHFKPVVDSLLAAGLELHYFEEGFAKENIEKAIAAPPDTFATKQISYRATASLLNEAVPAKLPLYIFTDNYLRNFAGNRTAVSLNLHWFTYTPDTTANKPVTDTTGLRITVFSGAHNNDARYLKASLDAIQQFSKKNIVTQMVTAATNVPAMQDWLFWLSDEPVPAAATARNVFQYARGKALPCHSSILPVGTASFNPVELFASIPEIGEGKNFSEVYWKDGYGRPLLVSEQASHIVYYRLYTHIDPKWNDLPWSGSFPQIIYALLYERNNQLSLPETAGNTIIDSSQLKPAAITEKEAGPKPILFAEIKLNSLFWLLAMLLFFAERCLSFYHRRNTANG